MYTPGMNESERFALVKGRISCLSDEKLLLALQSIEASSLFEDAGMALYRALREEKDRRGKKFFEKLLDVDEQRDYCPGHEHGHCEHPHNSTNLRMDFVCCHCGRRRTVEVSGWKPGTGRGHGKHEPPHPV